MKITQYRFDDAIEIVNLGDLHRGDKCCDETTFHEVIDYISRNKRTYWVSTGDLLNVALKHSKSDVYHSMSVKEELSLFLSEISDIRHKCLGIVGSNHHRRFEREVGISLDEMLCTQADIPFLGDIGVIDCTCGNCSYFIALHHGVGGGRTIGAKSNELVRFEDVISCADVYMQGHTHQYNHFVLESPYIDRKRKLISRVESHFVTTGHYLRWDDSYAQALKLRPAPIGSSIVTLYSHLSGRHDQKKITVDFIN